VLDVAVIFGVWMSLAMALGASFLIDVVAGARGHGAIPVLRIQSIALTATFISACNMFALLALRQYRPMLLASACALVVDVILGLALIPALGAQGGALADVITESLVALALTITVAAALPRRAIDAAVLPPVVLAASLGAAVWLLPVGSLAHTVLATVVYFATLLALGAIPVEVFNAARRLRAPLGAGPA
jgi:O-antigen/teichoic acid export membrane protein